MGGKLTEMLMDAFSSTTLNESIQPINPLAASEMLAVALKLSKLYKEIINAKIPESNNAVKCVDKYVEKFANSMNYFSDAAYAWINKLTYAADILNTLHIWFTEAVPELKKQLNENVFAQLSNVKDVSYNRKECMCIVYKNDVLLNAFRNGELKNFKVKNHSYTFSDNITTLLVNTDIHYLYERVTMKV